MGDLTVRQLKELIKDLPDDMIVYSAGEGAFGAVSSVFISEGIGNDIVLILDYDNEVKEGMIFPPVQKTSTS